MFRLVSKVLERPNITQGKNTLDSKSYICVCVRDFLGNCDFDFFYLFLSFNVAFELQDQDLQNSKETEMLQKNLKFIKVKIYENLHK